MDDNMSGKTPLIVFWTWPGSMYMRMGRACFLFYGDVIDNENEANIYSCMGL